MKTQKQPVRVDQLWRHKSSPTFTAVVRDRREHSYDSDKFVKWRVTLQPEPGAGYGHGKPITISEKTLHKEWTFVSDTPPAPERKSKDGLGQPLDDAAMYFIQDRRTLVGNCALWWAVDACGYTTEIASAGTYSGAYVRNLRDLDVPWPEDYVRANIVMHVRDTALERKDLS